MVRPRSPIGANRRRNAAAAAVAVAVACTTHPCAAAAASVFATVATLVAAGPATAAQNVGAAAAPTPERAGAPAATAAASDPIAEAVTGYTHHAGYLDLYWSDEAGELLVSLPRAGIDALYVNYLAGGVGSNDIGLDRGQIGDTRYVEFHVLGDRVLVIEPNQDYRAESADDNERRAVTEAFASSVLAALPVVARTKDRVLAKLSKFAVSDVHGISQRLAATGQGTFALDAERSVVLARQLAAFPANTVVEALLTFSGREAGPFLASVTPTDTAVTVRIRHEFIEPPAPGFQRRAYHPRSGAIDFEFMDFAAPLDEPLRRRFVRRHRLALDPATGRTVEPIVYYVDRGAPEPVRSALMEGAGWWAEAFAAAGYPDGFRVELLPEGVSPLDIRYNVIQWVHRATRGWSYGYGVIDPRTGEIVKGHVTLGSQRVRQDLLIAEGLTAPFGEGGDGGTAARELALARLRQLAAHEVGHTLGLAHNFAASVQEDASVMDYPHPNLHLTDDGRIDLSRAYDTGIGAWDRYAIDYLYHPFEAGAEAAGLAAIVAAGRDLLYLSDADARPPGSATPQAHLWDNGEDPIERLRELMAIRRVALDGFSADAIRADQPLAALEARLVPVYLLHRYQLEAVAKYLGGWYYGYGLRAEAPAAPQRVDGESQRAALTAMLDALAPSALRVPDEVLAALAPPDAASRRGREDFSHRTGRVFDDLAPVRAAAQLAAQLLLTPARVERIASQGAHDATLPGVADYLTALIEARVKIRPSGDAAVDRIAETVAWTLVREMQRLAVNRDASEFVRAQVMSALAAVQSWSAPQAGRRPFAAGLAAELARFAEDPEADGLPPRHEVPPGSPI